MTRIAASDGQTVLIVEDNELNIKLFRDLLAADGYVTLETNDGAEAVEAAGYDFDKVDEENEEHRVADTFRVISLSFSNLGDVDIVDSYFSQRGGRSYSDRIYGNLGEFYLEKLRYDDAASVYKSFIELNPFHKIAPHFGMRVVEIYGEAGFPQLVVESKKEFASTYALDARYWRHFDADDRPEVVGFLKANLTDLANHYHAIFQDDNMLDERLGSFDEAQHWYRQYLYSFLADTAAPQINYQLADLLLENDDYSEAARNTNERRTIMPNTISHRRPAMPLFMRIGKSSSWQRARASVRSCRRP